MPSATWANLPAAKRERILRAAMDEFGRHGFSAGSLNVVAREADVAKGSLFQYFTDKAELYAVVCERVSSTVRGELVGRMERELPSDIPFFDRLEILLDWWVEYFAAHQQERAITAATNLEIDPAARSAVRQVAHRHYLEVLWPLITAAAEREEFAADMDVEALATQLLWLFPHLAIAPFEPGLDPVLGLYGLSPRELREPLRRLVAPLRRAFGPLPARV